MKTLETLIPVQNGLHLIVGPNAKIVEAAHRRHGSLSVAFRFEQASQRGEQDIAYWQWVDFLGNRMGKREIAEVCAQLRDAQYPVFASTLHPWVMDEITPHLDDETGAERLLFAGPEGTIQMMDERDYQLFRESLRVGFLSVSETLFNFGFITY